MKSPAILLLFAAATSGTLSAAPLTWDGGDLINSNWSDADNWNPTRPAAAGDDLLFPAGPADKATVNNLPVGTVFHSLLFGGNGYSVAGNAFVTGSHGIRVNVSGAGTAVISPGVGLDVDQEWRTETLDDQVEGKAVDTEEQPRR